MNAALLTTTTCCAVTPSADAVTVSLLAPLMRSVKFARPLVSVVTLAGVSALLCAEVSVTGRLAMPLSAPSISATV